MQENIQIFIDNIERKKILLSNMSNSVIEDKNEKESLFINKTIKILKVFNLI